MKTFTRYFTLAAIACSLVGSTTQAQTDLLLHSFEGTDEGYEFTSTNSATSITPDNTGTFATDGTYSLRLEGQTNEYSQPAKVTLDPALLDNFSTIHFDYHVPGFDAFMNVGARFFADGWTGSGGFSSETVLSDTGTFSWNFKDDPNYASGSANASFILENFSAAGGSTTTSPLYIDNVRLSGGTPVAPFKYSWEDASLEGWTETSSYSGTGITPIASVNVAGGAPAGAITDGDYALKVSPEDWGGWTIQVEALGPPDSSAPENPLALQAMKANDTVEFDLFVETGEILPGSFTQIAFVLNQLGGFAADYNTINFDDTGSSYHVSWKYADHPLYDPETDWVQLKFLTQAGDGGEAIKAFYVDNMRFTTASVGLAGDFDGNDIVDGADFLLWQTDNSVGDLADWQANYGMSASTASPVASAVPEPTSAVLCLLGGLLGVSRRRS
ncbi:PEP-CTERM sorting domain-containing protein [Adhaeretor mobilis]|uniref:PEP-CTERM protein-sorting domain-containing protein n=1 Tax=Adhaeretor mobilis TaxID=1930276 RepID=A0A517MY18_9BACT|nr:PEP-CTERM sorting domain-containing protein [Adhaeretor mobilis]QDS99763.1 hypothetical protein HG15A2_30930 [Adhaeretor mobilis]